MDDRPPESAFVTRTAVRLGHTLGLWRRRRLEASQNKFVEAWKAAWTEGCEAAWQGIAIGTVPYRRGRRRDAWHAGWHWATTNPGPGSGDGAAFETRIYRPAEDPRPVVRAAARGAVGLTIVAAARWLWRARQRTTPTKVKGES